MSGSKEGVVIGKKMKKTAVVEVERVIRHPLYHKVLRVLKKYHVHDPKDECQLGQRVQIAAIRPISATKKFKLVKVLGKSGAQK